MTAQPAATDEGTVHDASDETAARLAKIDARQRDATRGPWGTAGPHQPGILTADGGNKILAVLGGTPQDEVDARFAAHARQDVPFLLARDADHTRRTAHLERALAAVTDFAEARVTDANTPWRHGYYAARQDLLDILRVTEPGVEAVPAGTVLFLAEYEGADPELYTSLQAAQDYCVEQLKSESPGKTWDWFPEEGGAFIQVYTSDLDDRLQHQAPGTVQRIIVRPDLAEGSEPPEDDLPHPSLNALRTDALGRPLCDGTRHRATRNCEDRAAFQLLDAATKKVEGHACPGHLGQMVDTVNGGEMGTVLTRQIAIKE